MPSRASAFSNTQRIERSSSIIQTGFIPETQPSSYVYPFANRQQYREARAARHAVELDQAVVLAHEALRERQPQAGSALAAAHQRIEDAVGELRGHARAVVLD